MYSASDAYIEAMRSLSRTVDVRLAVGVNVDLTASDDVSGTAATALPMSNTAQLLDAIYTLTEGLATFEGYGIQTAVSAGNVAPPISAVDYPPEAGVWSDVISDADGAIDWTLSITMSQSHTSAFTVYTEGPSVTAATATFYLDGEVVASGAMTPSTGTLQWSEAVTYDAVDVNITAIESPYCHVRVCEVEFGVSRTMSKSTLTDTVTLIQEMDRTQITLPLDELDFSILNIDGSWDIDNPDGLYSLVAVGNPVSAAFVCTLDSGASVTIPMGRFLVGEKDGSDTELRITCYDYRKALQDTYTTWSIDTTTPLGTLLDDLLTETHIPHLVEDEVLEIYADNPYTFTEEYSLLDAMLWIAQYYDIWLVPERDGQIHIRYGPPSGDYGDVDPDMEYDWPTPKGYTTYNYIQVAYGTSDATSYYNLDLRTTTSGGKSQVSISNPLILTVEKAEEVARRVASRLYADMVEMEWRTDLLADLGDSMGLYGRHASGTSTAYTLAYREVTYNGGLSAIVRGII